MRVLLIILFSLVSAAAFANLPHDLAKLKQETNQGNDKAKQRLMNIQYNHNHYVKAYHLAKQLLKSSDANYQSSASNLLGLYYLYGRPPVGKNLKKAKYYFKQAITDGYKKAYGNLALIYKQGGQDFKKNLNKAERYFRLAAKHNNAPAMFNIGNLYAHKNQYKKAFHWYHQAAKQYYLSGMYQTGASYFLGKGVPENKIKSCMWLKLALKVYPGYKLAKGDLTTIENTMDYMQRYSCRQAVKKYLKHHDVPRKSDFKARLELKS